MVGSPAPRLSVVVPTRDRPAMLEDCLIALRAELTEADELVVVDSASSTAETAAVAHRHDATYVRCAIAGASRARNAGWRSAAAPVVAFVDDDVRVSAGWAKALLDALADPAVAFVTGRLDVPANAADVDRPVAVKTETEPAALDASTRGTLGASANLAVRRDVLASVGGFDERLGPATWFASGEDVDLFDRLLAAGHVGRYQPDARAEHEQWRGRAARLRLDWSYGKGQGARLARLTRRDRRRARMVAHDAVWRGNVVALGTHVRERYEYGVLALVVKLAGTVAGYVVGLVTLR